MTTKIRLLSDLHFEGGEHKELYKSQGEDILVLAGDINVGAIAEWNTVKKFANEQPNVVWIAGNHTFYRQDYHDTCRKLEDWSAGTSIHFLNPGVVYYNDGKLSSSPTLGSIKFIGGCLWTNFRNNDLSKLHAKAGINDFRLIEFSNRYFTPNDAHLLFDQQYGYIKHEYEENDYKKVIVTHFLPCVECIDPQYLGNASSTLNDYFANDLGHWVSTLDNVPLLLHGHTHSNVNITLGATQIVANPYGYGYNKHYKECLLEV